MYLDKPLKDHTLLQAIARVNRPYRPDKTNGLVVDYIGIFEDLQRALTFDTENVQTGLIDLNVLRERFTEMMQEAALVLAPLDLNNITGRTDRIVDYFFDPERREMLVRLFKEIEIAYEILSPDPFLRCYIDSYALLAGVYRVVYNAFDPEAERRRIQYDLLAKTDSLIRENVELVSLADSLPVYEINRDIARVIEADDVTERVKVANLHRSLVIHIERNRAQQPYLISLSEKVEEVLLRLRDRQISVQAALEQLTGLAEQAHAAREEQEASGLPGNSFALFWVLRAQGVNNAEALTEQIHSLLSDNAAWPYNPEIERRVRLQLYKLLAGPQGGDAEALKETVDNLLKMHRILTG
jgi:type I restriction enzyme R subunit